MLCCGARGASSRRAPAIDVGCATGGTTFAIARAHTALTLGVDLNFAMLRVASRALREGRVRYAQRRVGVVYDRRELDVDRDERPRRLLVLRRRRAAVRRRDVRARVEPQRRRLRRRAARDARTSSRASCAEP